MSLLDEILEAVPTVRRGELLRQRQVVQRHAHRTHGDACRTEGLYVATSCRAEPKGMAEVAGQANRQAVLTRRPWARSAGQGRRRPSRHPPRGRAQKLSTATLSANPAPAAEA